MASGAYNRGFLVWLTHLVFPPSVLVYDFLFSVTIKKKTFTKQLPHNYHKGTWNLRGTLNLYVPGPWPLIFGSRINYASSSLN